MNPFAKQLAELKVVLQDLESAVQQPLDERFTVQMILTYFPQAFAHFTRVLTDALMEQGELPVSAEDVYTQASARGWLTGDLALWLRLVNDAVAAESEDLGASAAAAIAQDVRACSYMLWETYDLLTARFRYQTQIRPVPAQMRFEAPAPAVHSSYVHSA